MKVLEELNWVLDRPGVDLRVPMRDREGAMEYTNSRLPVLPASTTILYGDSESPGGVVEIAADGVI
jgi:hypothetical protein